MNGDEANLQNDFFNRARKEHRTVTIFLTNGKRLTGRIKSFDKFTLLLDGPHGELMLFKHAISTVSVAGDAEAWAHPDDEAAHRDAQGRTTDRPAAGST
jgi:host factor-I protein